MTETRYDVVFDLSTADTTDAHSVVLPDGYVTRVGMVHGGTAVPGGIVMQAGFNPGAGRNGLIYRGATSQSYAPVTLLGLRCYSGEKIYCQAVRAQDAAFYGTTPPTLSIWVETDLEHPPPGLATPIVDQDIPYFTSSLSLAAPAAGADYATITSQNTEYRVVGANLTITASAPGSNRFLQVNGVEMRTQSGGWYAVPSASTTFMQPAAETPWARSITFETQNLDAADQYSAGTLYVQERALL